MNEISVQITYFRKKGSWSNITNLKLKLPPYISHGKFITMRQALGIYESHCKSNFIQSIPNLLRQKTLKAKEKVKDVVENRENNAA